MANSRSRVPSTVVRLTALGFTLTMGAATATAGTGEEASDPGTRLARLSQARAEGKFDIDYISPAAPAQAGKARRSLEMQKAQFASQWSSSFSNSG